MRRRVLLVTGATLAAAITVLVMLLAVTTASGGAMSGLIGALGSDRLAGLALIAAFEDGAYAVLEDGDSLRVWYTFNFDSSLADHHPAQRERLSSEY